MRLSASDEASYPPKAVQGDCPVCQRPLGLGGIDCVSDMRKRWFHHHCQMEMIVQTANQNAKPTGNMQVSSLDRASRAAGNFLEKSGITDMALMSYEDWRLFIEATCKAYVQLEDDEIPF